MLIKQLKHQLNLILQRIGVMRHRQGMLSNAMKTTVFLVMLCSWAMSAHAKTPGYGTTKDGCKVWLDDGGDEYGSKNDKIWSGKCVNGYVTGYGVLQEVFGLGKADWKIKGYFNKEGKPEGKYITEHPFGIYVNEGKGDSSGVGIGALGDYRRDGYEYSYPWPDSHCDVWSDGKRRDCASSEMSEAKSEIARIEKKLSQRSTELASKLQSSSSDVESASPSSKEKGLEWVAPGEFNFESCGNVDGGLVPGPLRSKYFSKFVCKAAYNTDLDVCLQRSRSIKAALDAHKKFSECSKWLQSTLSSCRTFVRNAVRQCGKLAN